MNSYPRDLAATLHRLAGQFPVIGLTGPRQSGKSTLVRQLFANKPYVSLEDPGELDFARSDAQGFLRRFEGGRCSMKRSAGRNCFLTCKAGSMHSGPRGALC